MSASDPQKACRRFVEENPQHCCKPTHWYKGIAEQHQGHECFLHSGSGTCNPAPQEVDFATCGAPCHPYSTQRAGRFKKESVEAHHEYQVSMEDFFRWLLRFAPKSLVFWTGP